MRCSISCEVPLWRGQGKPWEEIQRRCWTGMGSVLNGQQVILDLLSHLCVLNMLIRLGRYEIKELFCFLVKWRSLSWWCEDRKEWKCQWEAKGTWRADSFHKRIAILDWSSDLADIMSCVPKWLSEVPMEKREQDAYVIRFPDVPS